MTEVHLTQLLNTQYCPTGERTSTDANTNDHRRPSWGSTECALPAGCDICELSVYPWVPDVNGRRTSQVMSPYRLVAARS
jgi:hypothetical protein